MSQTLADQKSVSVPDQRCHNNTISQKKRKMGMRYAHLSPDAEIPDPDVESLKK